MSNRVRYYITESDDKAVVRSVPVTVTTQPQHELIAIDRPDIVEERQPTSPGKPVGRIVKVLRKPAQAARK
jgi:hypothetical protein